MPYFHISSGPRGCYMPDNAAVIYVKTRRELRAAIAYEAECYREAGFVGANARAVSAVATAAWRERSLTLPYALPLAPPHARRNYCHGVFVSRATRDDYRDYVRES